MLSGRFGGAPYLNCCSRWRFLSFLAGLTDFPVDLALASAMTLLPFSLFSETESPSLVDTVYDVAGWANSGSRGK